MFARHSLWAATRFIEPTTRSPTTRADVHAGIRDVLLEAHDFAEELQRVDDRRGLLEALHAHHADPLRAGEDLQDGRIPDEMRGLHEVRPRREEDAPWDRDV